MGKMKHEMEESSGGATSKGRRIRQLKKLPTPKELRKNIFLGCRHGSIMTFMKEEVDYVKKVGLAQIEKLDSTLVDEPVVKEMVNNYNHAN
jgi:hypothetical protein